jgi:hypothetical protein
MSDSLPVPVSVDPDTGVWSVDGMPMILVPRHFWMAVHEATEKRFGVEENSVLLYDASCSAAFTWCEMEAKTHGLSGTDVFHHYMDRRSRRGWGRCTVELLDADAGHARVRMTNSVFVYASGPEAGRNVCYMFNGSLSGAMEYVTHDLGRRRRKMQCEEIHCAANGADDCLFEVRPA